MEALSESLQPYKETIGQVASIVTIAQFFSGVFICKDIYNQKSTKGVSAVPFIGGIVVGTLMLKYAKLLNDPAMLQVNVAAIFLNFLYLGFYGKFAPHLWNDVLKPVSFGVALIATILGYANWEDPSNLEYRYGLLVTVLMLLLLGSPLIQVKSIIANKDASSIPFPMTFMGTIVSFLWLVYGVILLNNFMIVQNAIGFILCFVQLVLIFIYPGKPAQSKKKKAKKEQ